MPVVMPNVLISTSRPNFTVNTGTSAPSEYLSEVEAHQGPVPQQDYVTLPESALESQYLIKVEIGTDINKGHTIPRMTLNDAPVYTPWDELGDHEALLVTFARNSAAGPLQHRQLYCKRITAGGPSV